MPELKDIVSKCDPKEDCFEAVVVGQHLSSTPDQKLKCNFYHESETVPKKYKLEPGENNSGLDEDIYLQILTNTKQRVIDSALKNCIDDNTDDNNRAHCVVKSIKINGTEMEEFNNSLGYEN